MTGMARSWLQTNFFAKGLPLLVFIALFGAILFSHQAAAGGPIMIARSFIQGKDEISGKTYTNPTVLSIYQNNTVPHTLRVYQGDVVSFYYYVQNWDPIPFIPGNVDIKYHNVDLTGKDTVTHEESRSYANIIPLLPSGYWYNTKATRGKVVSDKVTISGPGSAVPGKQFCAYVETNPTVYDYLDPTTLLTGLAQSTGLSYGVAVGDHKFASHSDALPIPLGLFAALKINVYAIPLGDTMSCAEIAYNYDLTPTIDLGSQTGSGGLNVTSGMQNDSLPTAPVGTPTTYTQQTQWKVTQFFDTPADITAKKLDRTTTSDSKDPCAYLQSKLGKAIIKNASQCTVPVKSSGENTVFDKNGFIDFSLSKQGATSLPTSVPSPGVVPAGMQVCYVLSVSTYQPYQSDPHWRNSAVRCTNIDTLVNPTTHILGDDLHVGGDILTHNTKLGDAVASWAQYAAYAAGASKCFATASDAGSIKAVAAAASPADPSQADINTLTFANNVPGNTACNTTFGGFTTSSALLHGAAATHDSLAGQASGSGNPAATIDPTATTYKAKRTVYLASPTTANLTVQAGSSPVSKGTSLIIVSKKPVVIGSNIIYASDTGDSPSATLSDITQIPQVIIVAPSITINAAVTQVDAWLVTDVQTDDAPQTPITAANTHYVNTCADAGSSSDSPLPSGLVTTKCDQPLTVNGPVMTSHLYLNRTTDPTTGPAETFDNRGDAYLWALATASANPTLTTTLQRELPPRF